MRADLQRFYGLCLDDLGHGFGALHAACCLVCLPYEASTWERYRKDNPHDEGAKGNELPELQAVTHDEWERWRSQEFKEVDGWREEA